MYARHACRLSLSHSLFSSTKVQNSWGQWWSCLPCFPLRGGLELFCRYSIKLVVAAYINRCAVKLTRRDILFHARWTVLVFFCHFVGNSSMLKKDQCCCKGQTQGVLCSLQKRRLLTIPWTLSQCDWEFKVYEWVTIDGILKLRIFNENKRAQRAKRLVHNEQLLMQVHGLWRFWLYIITEWNLPLFHMYANVHGLKKGLHDDHHLV